MMNTSKTFKTYKCCILLAASQSKHGLNCDGHYWRGVTRSFATKDDGNYEAVQSQVVLKRPKAVPGTKTKRRSIAGNNYSKELSDKFKHWFIGFAEGDGSFSVSKEVKLVFSITQSSIDVQILLYIQKEIGFGWITLYDKVKRCHSFTVRDRQGLFKLIEIFNGNLYLEKVLVRFKLWVQAFNKRYKENIIFINQLNYPTLSNAWLSGFTDAEGYFTVSVTKRTEKSHRVRVRYGLSQKGEGVVISHFAAMLGGRSHLNSRDGVHNMEVSLTKAHTIIAYLAIYKLKTKKRLDYFNWLKVYELVAHKQHLTAEGFLKIKELVSKINKNQVLASATSSQDKI